jgi:hypothetical protein
MLCPVHGFECLTDLESGQSGRDSVPRSYQVRRNEHPACPRFKWLNSRDLQSVSTNSVPRSYLLSDFSAELIHYLVLAGQSELGAIACTDLLGV